MRPTEAITVTRACTVHQALKCLQDTGQGILLLVDDQGLLLRTVTDGDIRRLLLAHASMDASLAQLPAQRPHTIQAPAARQDVLAAMDRAKVDQLPVVDTQGKPLGIHLRRDFGAPILLSTPHMGDHELGFVQEAFRSNWIAPLGPNVDAFEQEVADYVGICHAAALSSGTAAIHLALRLLNVGPGDRVFCSTLTFVATANPILYQGAEPVFIDSEPESWNMSPAALERALEDAAQQKRLPKAILVVNLYGQSARMEVIEPLCARYGIPVIEDAAESLGAMYRGRHSGTFGRLGIYSFNGNKIITTSGGGMLISDDDALIAKARFLATQARDPAPYYEHTEVGYNYRMSNILAGIGRGQLKVLEERVAARRGVFEHYAQALRGMDEVVWMPELANSRATRWLTACTLHASHAPDAVIAALASEGIEARRVWKPMHLQPLFAQQPFYPHAPGLDVAKDLFERGLCLPSGSNMTSEQLERISAALRQALRP